MWLPPKDDVLAPGIFNQGTPGPRWFDFSSAPDMPGFDSSTCARDITWAGQRAFHMHQREANEWVVEGSCCLSVPLFELVRELSKVAFQTIGRCFACSVCFEPLWSLSL